MNLVAQREVISHYLKSEIGRMVEHSPIDSFHHQLASGLAEFVQSTTESKLRKIVHAIAVDYRQSSVYRELYNEEASERWYVISKNHLFIKNSETSSNIFVLASLETITIMKLNG